MGEPKGRIRTMQTYEVRIARQDAIHVQATVRDFTLQLGAKRGDAGAGFNPVETLLSAVGTCFLTALAFVAELSHVCIDNAVMTLEATRQDRPPIVVGIRYVLQVASDLEESRMDRIIELAKRNSTVFQTISLAVPIEGRWVRQG